VNIQFVRNQLKELKRSIYLGDPFKKWSISDKGDLAMRILNGGQWYKSHQAYTWNAKEHLCGCRDEKGMLMYMPFGYLHFLSAANRCVVGNLCWCIDLKTYELRRHVIGACPDGKYGWKPKTLSRYWGF
jgi:hypothetical protein